MHTNGSGELAVSQPLAPPRTGEAAARTDMARRNWAANRAAMEERKVKQGADGRRRVRYWSLFRTASRAFGVTLKATGLYGWGVRNALDIRTNEIELSFDGLPRAFDGYRILHLSDLHIDAIDALAEAVRRRVAAVEADLCVMTGDYRQRVRGPYEHIIEPMAAITRSISAPDGILATLGNHDTWRMVQPFESLGMRVLTNESFSITRGDSHLHLTGTDDIHYYYTDQAGEAITRAADGFRIALVHSPALAGRAARAGYDLYLTGHTHNGQVCLPGGVPIITHSGGNRRYSRGVWRCGAMTGYTTAGAGVSALPVRFNSRSEIAVIMLRRANS